MASTSVHTHKDNDISEWKEFENEEEARKFFKVPKEEEKINPGGIV